MKLTLQPPVDRIVTLEMTESEAKILRGLAPNLSRNSLVRLGASGDMACKGETVFASLYFAINETL